MPTYDYECAECGRFRARRALSEYALPLPCPACGTLARKLVVAPYLSDMKAGIRKAHERNEKSAHEPAVVRTGEHGFPGGHHDHGAGAAHPDHASGGWVRSRHPSMIGH